MNNTVHSQFQTLERRINMVDSVLTKVEQQFDQQDQQVSSMISQKKEKADSQLKDADLLLRNVKGAFQV